MRILCVAAFLLLKSIREQPLDGVYVNHFYDITLRLYGQTYELESAHPLMISPKKRHIDFEAGRWRYSKRHLELRRAFLFHSPTRSSYLALFAGGLHPGFKEELKSAKEQKKFLAEISWRVVKTPGYKYAEVKNDVEGFSIVVDGVTLAKESRRN